MSAKQRIVEALLKNPFEEDMYKEAGRAVIALSGVENLLVTYCILLSPGANFEAADMFYEQGSFERRLRFTDFVILRWSREKVTKGWKPILGAVQTHRGIRNLVAHQGMALGEPDDRGVRPVYLEPPTFKKNGKGRRLTIDEIRRTANALKPTIAFAS